MAADPRYILPFRQCTGSPRVEVGGKNASLGELIARLSGEGVAVPDGFAVTVAAYRRFLHHNGLEAFIRDQLACAGKGDGKLVEAADNVHSAVVAAEMPADVREGIAAAYKSLGAAAGVGDVAVAVTSSATAEDPAEAGIADHEDAFLGIRGADNVVTHCIRCFASLFTDRTMAERTERGPAWMPPATAVAVQRMVGSDVGASGAAFSLDHESGNPHVVLIDAAWGLGELVLRGRVDPDRFIVSKPLLRDGGDPLISKSLGAKQQKMIFRQGRGGVRPGIVDTPEEERRRFCLDEAQACLLARWVVAIERHFGGPVEMEWALDGAAGGLFVVRARPHRLVRRRSRAEMAEQAGRQSYGVLAAE